MTTKRTQKTTHFHIFMLLGAGLLLRIFFAASNQGFGSDTACFAAWADRMYSLGPSGFYSADFFTDYPPGFMYVLYLVGALKSLFQIPAYSGIHLLLLKLPSILCDILCSYAIYKVSSECFTSREALFLTSFYLFNPAIILNSSVWGQVDSVLTLFIVLMCLALINGSMLPAYIAFGIGVLIKPQMLVFAPVLLAGILDHVFLRDFSIKKLLHNLLQGLGVITGMLLLCLPFGLENVLPQYIETLGSYPYVTVNGYNFWALLGLSWVPQENSFGFFTYQQWGILVILLIVILCFVISLRMKHNDTKYPLLGAYVILTMFLFSVRMHDRYMYPGLVLLLLCYLYLPRKAILRCYMGFSLLHFANTYHVLFCYDPQNYNAKSPVILAVSAGMLACCFYFYYIIKTYYIDQKGSVHRLFQKKSLSQKSASFGAKGSSTQGLPPLPSDSKMHFTKLDAVLLFSIMLLYGAFALYDLGDRTAPSTAYEMQQNDSIVLDFGENNAPAILSYYIAPWQDRSFTVYGKEKETDAWQSVGEIVLSNVFTWQDIDLKTLFSGITTTSGDCPRYVKLTLNGVQASLLDITFTDAEDNTVLPENASDYAELFDENDLHPAEYTFRNSMYFDEIYHGRTAYEFLHGLTTYENTHPPLGKIFIALGVAIFGMNPFGWRIIGTLFGIAMLPFLYLFGKRMTNNTPAAALACFLFAFDFMHFAQTRLATIDVYITFFVIIMYYFMFCYCRMSFYDTPLKRTLLPLGACGVAFGLGLACKWTGAYAGAGLAVLFFAVLLRRYREYQYAMRHPLGRTGDIAHTTIIERFVPYTKKTIGFCLVFFVAVPIVIYVLSYIPFVDYSSSSLVEKMVQNQISMFRYHSELEASHPFSSSWYEWPTITRPVWYYSHKISDTLREGISSFGNPLVWWMGIPAFLYMVYLLLHNLIKRKNQVPSNAPDSRTLVFLIVGYLAQYLPWFFVTRITFIYHYFPSVAFVVLMIVYSLMQLKKRISNRAFVTCIIVYGAAVFGLFLLFYPVLSGQPVEIAFVEKYLRWFEGWVLVAN